MRVVALTANRLSLWVTASFGGAGEGRVKLVCCSRERAYHQTHATLPCPCDARRCRSRGDRDRYPCLGGCSVDASIASIVCESGEYAGNCDDQRSRTGCGRRSRHRPQHPVRSDRQLESSLAGQVDPARGVLPQRHHERNRRPHAPDAWLRAHRRAPRRHERLEADRPSSRALETEVEAESRRQSPHVCRPARRSSGESGMPPAR